MGRSALESVIITPHIKHPNPHPQYALKDDVDHSVATVMEDTTTVTNNPPAAESVADLGAVGASDEAAREDHRHPMPDIATILAPGFMSAADKAKLDGLPTGAEIDDELDTAIAALDLRFLRVDDDAVWDETNGDPVMALTATGVSQVVVG